MRLNLFEDPFGEIPVREIFPFLARWLPADYFLARYLKWMVVASLVAIAIAFLTYLIDRVLKAAGMRN